MNRIGASLEKDLLKISVTNEFSNIQNVTLSIQDKECIREFLKNINLYYNCKITVERNAVQLITLFRDLNISHLLETYATIDNSTVKGFTYNENSNEIFDVARTVFDYPKEYLNSIRISLPYNNVCEVFALHGKLPIKFEEATCKEKQFALDIIDKINAFQKEYNPTNAEFKLIEKIEEDRIVISLNKYTGIKEELIIQTDYMFKNNIDINYVYERFNNHLISNILRSNTMINYIKNIDCLNV